MYDVGILTFWGVPNYGTFAQAYALQKTVQKLRPDLDVRQIAYLNPTHYDFYFSKWPKCGVRNPAFLPALLQNLRKDSVQNQRKAIFEEGYRTIPHTPQLSAKDLKKTKFRTVILGSDIVWDYSIPVFGDDPFLFGNGLLADKVISYAASFGTVKPGQEAPNFVKSGIRGLRHTAVRDENSAEIVKELSGEMPPVVLDPVWMWDFSTDENVVVPAYQNYLVVYGQDFTEDFIEQTICYAKEKNLKTICLDCNEDSYTWCDVLIKQQDLSVYEWLGMFKGAQAVATSTFHGLTFGLVFEKPLAFCRTDFIMAKAGSFLKKLGLYDLYENNTDVKKMLEHRRDIQATRAVVGEMRRESEDYLAKALA